MVVEIDRIVERIKKAFPDVELDEEKIRKQLKLLIYEFRVPVDEAVRTIMYYVKKEYGVEAKPVSRDAKIGEIGEEIKEGDWVNLEVKVVKLWDPSSPSVAQAGLIGDETGIIKFVAWSKSEIETQLEEGKCYRLENLVVHEFGDRYQVNINRNTVITPIDKDIQLPERTIEIIAVMTKILSNSGLIRRCPECNRVIKDVCPTHGKVKPVEDLRLKVVFDDNERTYDAILNEEAIAKLTGIDLKKALEIAKENMDRNAVLKELEGKLLCKYYKVKGAEVGKFVLVKDIEFLKPDFGKLLAEII